MKYENHIGRLSQTELKDRITPHATRYHFFTSITDRTEKEGTRRGQMTQEKGRRRQKIGRWRVCGCVDMRWEVRASSSSGHYMCCHEVWNFVNPSAGRATTATQGKPPHFTIYTLHFTLLIPHSTLHTLHFTLYTPHSTLHTPHLHFTLRTLHHFTIYTLNSTLYTPHFTLYTPHSTLYTVHSTLYTLHSTLHTRHSTLPTLHFTLHTGHSTLLTLHSTLHTLHFTLHAPHSTLYSPHFTLHTLHFTLHTLHFALHPFPHSTVYSALVR